ncbi:MAG: tyrosine-type recombinase/integrase [Halobacteria archaeon]
MSDSGKLDTKSIDEDKYREAPFDYLINQKKRYKRSERTIQQTESSLKFAREYFSREEFLSAGPEDIIEYHDWLKKNTSRNECSRKDLLSTLGEVYNLGEGAGVLSTNPARVAIRELRESGVLTPSSPSRMRIEMEEMKDFLGFLSTPFERAVFLTLLKTGVRAGELINIDLCCLNLDHVLYRDMLDEYGVELRDEIQNLPDSLYIYPAFSGGDVAYGEQRRRGNKRKDPDGTTIPIDEELKTALIEYILTRRYTPRDGKPQPLFVKKRVHGDTPRWGYYGLQESLIRCGAVCEYGWWEDGVSTEEKVTLHYFRHYFSNNHRYGHGVYDGNMHDSVIKYIRGDVGGDDGVLDNVYTHSGWQRWSENIKEPYLENVYQFGLYD